MILHNKLTTPSEGNQIQVNSENYFYKACELPKGVTSQYGGFLQN